MCIKKWGIMTTFDLIIDDIRSLQIVVDVFYVVTIVGSLVDRYILVGYQAIIVESPEIFISFMALAPPTNG